MLKKMILLKTVKKLSAQEQKAIKGGLACGRNGYCPSGTHCVNSGVFEGLCRPN
jgi:hypothetical protein